jgi:hypothetical protein
VSPANSGWDSRYRTGEWTDLRDPTQYAVLTADQVKEIRRRLGDDPPFGKQTELAKQYGVSRACINDIHRRKTWAWL